MILPRRPRLRSGSQASLDSTRSLGFRRPPSKFVPAPEAPPSHISVYRSLQMEIQLYSPSAKVVHNDNQFARLLPVFGEHDQVVGKVGVDPSWPQPGRLCISIEGAFLYSSQSVEVEEGSSSSTRQRRHVFFSSSKSIPVSPGGETGSSPRSGFRDAFSPSSRRRPSLPCLNGATTIRFYPFSFDLPRSCRPGEELPSSFSSLNVGSRGRKPSADGAEVAYKITASWEADHDISNRAVLDAPFLFQPDTDFQSLDVLSLQPEAWLEMPLRSDRPIPFQCAITLPRPVAFRRATSVPYFVVFTTMPRSSSLAREIASDATISVSLLRQITINDSISQPPTPPYTPPPSGEEAEPSLRGRNAILKRVVRSARSARAQEESQNKSLPELPTAMSECRTLSTSMCIGFPKRPRQRCEPKGHPALESYKLLPDGLFKGKIPLSRDMLPCVDWAGLTIKYYLDVSVLVGQDDLRARIPIRVF